jgi:hypothetical protein
MQWPGAGVGQRPETTASGESEYSALPAFDTVLHPGLEQARLR